jgi:hypothetical protein
MNRRFGLAFLLVLLSMLLGGPRLVGAQTATPPSAVPPTQPARGPGGSDSAYAEVIATRFGELPTGFWLFEPAAPVNAMPVPAAPLPLVLAVPGWGDPRPDQLRTWIDYLVRRGAVVVFPKLAGWHRSHPGRTGCCPGRARARQPAMRRCLPSACLCGNRSFRC